MASNFHNDSDSDDAPTSFQALAADLTKIDEGTTNLPEDAQLRVIEKMQTQWNNIMEDLKDRVVARAGEGQGNGATTSHAAFQPQGSDWEDVPLHYDAPSPSSSSSISYGSWTSSSRRRRRSSSSSISSISSSGSRRRRPERSQRTQNAVGNNDHPRTPGRLSIGDFLQTMFQSLKNMWLRAEAEGRGNICKTIFYFVRNLVTSIFSCGDDTSDPPTPSALRYAISP